MAKKLWPKIVITCRTEYTDSNINYINCFLPTISDPPSFYKANEYYEEVKICKFNALKDKYLTDYYKNALYQIFLDKDPDTKETKTIYEEIFKRFEEGNAQMVKKNKKLAGYEEEKTVIQTMKGTVRGKAMMESEHSVKHAMPSRQTYVPNYDYTPKYAMPTQSRKVQPMSSPDTRNERNMPCKSDLPERWTREILSMDEWDDITNILKLGELVKLRTNDFETYLHSDHMALFYREERSDK